MYFWKLLPPLIAFPRCWNGLTKLPVTTNGTEHLFLSMQVYPKKSFGPESFYKLLTPSTNMKAAQMSNHGRCPNNKGNGSCYLCEALNEGNCFWGIGWTDPAEMMEIYRRACEAEVPSQHKDRMIFSFFEGGKP